jgi:hypothetical protein
MRWLGGCMVAMEVEWVVALIGQPQSPGFGGFFPIPRRQLIETLTSHARLSDVIERRWF